MEVVTHVSRGFSCNTYLCRDEASGKLCVIDPGTSAEEVLSLLGGEKPEMILLTHGHFDHALAAPILREKTGAVVCAHLAERELLRDPDKNASSYFGAPALSFEADVSLSEGDTVTLGETVFSVLHTPGHSPGGVCYRAGTALFVGDTVFAQGVGRTDLFGGDDGDLARSLSRLQALKDVSVLYCGHGPSCRHNWRFAQKGDEIYG